jgi:HPt (histidine-containing phosphotransfer) domain-containing protein
MQLDPRLISTMRKAARAAGWLDSGALPRLVEIFAGQSPERLQELRDSIESEAAGVVARLAHTMKGGAASLGAQHMAAAEARA